MARKWLPGRLVSSAGIMLQWDRTSDGAEILLPHAVTAALRSFNGTAPVMARKWWFLTTFRTIRLLLQWDRTSDGAEMDSCGATAMQSSRLQWDRTSDGAEIPASQRRTKRRWSFNGTAPVMARKSPPAAPPIGQSPGFNGTAPVMARKFLTAAGADRANIRLQWDRTSDGAEIAWSPTLATPATFVSISERSTKRWSIRSLTMGATYV